IDRRGTSHIGDVGGDGEVDCRSAPASDDGKRSTDTEKHMPLPLVAPTGGVRQAVRNLGGSAASLRSLLHQGKLLGRAKAEAMGQGLGTTAGGTAVPLLERAARHEHARATPA